MSGDLNIHVDVCNDSNAEKLAKLLDSFECKQHVLSTDGHGRTYTDLKASRLCADVSSSPGMSVDDLAELYDTTMSDLLDKHYPIVKVCHKFGPLTPWFDAECANLEDI